MFYDTRVEHSAYQNRFEGSFWHSVSTFSGTAAPRVAPRVFFFCSWAVLVDLVHHFFYKLPTWNVLPTELFGAAIGIILVFRTNAGYDRWWEARKVWGGIVNQSRNLAIAIVEYGSWSVRDRHDLMELVSEFPNAVKLHLREEMPMVQPTYISHRIARYIGTAHDQGRLSEMAFLRLDQERAKLIDYLGMCERIKKTPMPHIYAVEARRLLFLFLALAPFGIVGETGIHMPIAILLASYPLLSLDQIGNELQKPFSRSSPSHLPLDDICQSIHQDVAEIAHQHS